MRIFEEKASLHNFNLPLKHNTWLNTKKKLIHIPPSPVLLSYCLSFISCYFIKFHTRNLMMSSETFFPLARFSWLVLDFWVFLHFLFPYRLSLDSNTETEPTVLLHFNTVFSRWQQLFFFFCLLSVGVCRVSPAATKGGRVSPPKSQETFFS